MARVEMEPPKAVSAWFWLGARGAERETEVPSQEVTWMPMARVRGISSWRKAVNLVGMAIGYRGERKGGRWNMKDECERGKTKDKRGKTEGWGRVRESGEGRGRVWGRGSGQ